MAFHGIHGYMDINRKHWVDSMEMGVRWLHGFNSNYLWNPCKLIESVENWCPWKWSPNTPWKWQWNPRISMEISETGVVQQMHVLSDVFWVTESNSIMVFVKFIYGISLSQNFFFTTSKDQSTKLVALLGPDNFFLTTWEPDNLFFNKWKPDIFFENLQSPPPPWVSNGPPLSPNCRKIH